jgi:RNA polymerase sigma factor (sigma-70 family)
MRTGKPTHAILQYLRRVRAAAPAEGVSDAELLRRFAASREEPAFELLVWRHGAMVQRVCRGILRDSAAAEDAFQAAFIALASKASAVARHPSPAAWLYRVACHVALNARSGEARRKAREAARAPAPDAPAADVVAETAEQAAILHAEVNRLAARYRVPVVLCYLEGNTHEEAARRLGWPKGTVSGRLARARDLLKNRLIRRGVTPPALGLAVLQGSSADAALSGELAAQTVRATTGFVAGSASTPAASAAACRLAKGVIHTMLVAKLRTVAAALGLAACVVVGAYLPPGKGPAVAVAALADEPRTDERAPAKASGVDDLILQARRKRDSITKLKWLCLAQHNFHNQYGHFARNNTDSQGKQLLSWRVAILPFLEEGALYKEFHLSEPWDSEHNKKLLGRMPKVYRLPAQPNNATDTYYQGFAGPGTMFDPAGPVRMSDVTDGTSNTIFIVEAATAVPWTKPEDLPYDAAKPLPGLGGAFPEVFHAALVDGSVHTLARNFAETAMRMAITRNDGQVLDHDSLRNGSPRSAPDKGKAPDETTSDLDQLKAQNAKLRERLQQLEVDLAKARLDLARTNDRVAPSVETRKQASKLSAENASLADSLVRKLDELQQIRHEMYLLELQKKQEK